MKKIKISIFTSLVVLALAGCSTAGEASVEESSTAISDSSITYEVKELTNSDVKGVSYGDSLEDVYDTLGKPLKEWTSEFVYDSLDSAISRDEITLTLLGEDSKDADKYVQLVEDGRRALEIDRLLMLQYTYKYDDTDQTFLTWISPRTNTVVHVNSRSHIDENGESTDPLPDNNNAESTDDVLPTNTVYNIGEAISFSDDADGMITVLIDSVSKYEGDDYHIPDGVFFAKVDFTVENLGNSPFDINAHYFEFYDDAGFKANRISKDYFSETIQAGKSAKGTVYFDVVSEGNTFEVFFADASWTGEYQ